MIRRDFLQKLVRGAAGLYLTDDALELLTERRFFPGADLEVFRPFSNGPCVLQSGDSLFIKFINHLKEEEIQHITNVPQTVSYKGIWTSRGRIIRLEEVPIPLGISQQGTAPQTNWLAKETPMHQENPSPPSEFDEWDEEDEELLDDDDFEETEEESDELEKQFEEGSEEADSLN